jgi:hypothetical protein
MLYYTGIDVSFTSHEVLLKCAVCILDFMRNVR